MTAPEGRARLGGGRVAAAVLTEREVLVVFFVAEFADDLALDFAVVVGLGRAGEVMGKRKGNGRFAIVNEGPRFLRVVHGVVRSGVHGRLLSTG